MTVTSDDDVAVSEMIDAHLRHLTAASRSPKTIRGRRDVLNRLHRDLPFGVAYASTEELEAWLGSNPTWSAWTRSTYAMHIRGFYRWADGRYLANDPTKDMAKPRNPKSVPKPVTDDELTRALEHAPEPFRTVILFAAYAGLRVSEAAGVYREDVTEHDIRIRKAKGGDPASVDTHPALWEAVKSRSRGPLAPSSTGLEVSGKWFTDRERKLFDRLGLPSVTFHRFRHWFGTTLLDCGNDLRTVQEAMRHASVTSTQGYTLVRGGQRRLAIRSLPNPTERPSEH
jgi:integrase/recombinase XerD